MQLWIIWRRRDEWPSSYLYTFKYGDSYNYIK